MFCILCFERFTCLTNIEIVIVITFKFVCICECVFVLFGDVCSFVCEVSLEYVIYSVHYRDHVVMCVNIHLLF
jgi:hypothetical protein